MDFILGMVDSHTNLAVGDGSLVDSKRLALGDLRQNRPRISPK